MIIYEVNIKLLDSNILEDYKSWLKIHIKDMLSLPCFTLANTYTKQNINELDTIITLCVHYVCPSYDELQQYFNTYAHQMRSQVPNEFHEKYEIKRCILKKQ